MILVGGKFEITSSIDQIPWNTIPFEKTDREPESSCRAILVSDSIIRNWHTRNRLNANIRVDLCVCFTCILSKFGSLCNLGEINPKAATKSDWQIRLAIRIGLISGDRLFHANSFSFTQSLAGHQNVLVPGLQNNAHMKARGK
jgi:hypothetical protein